MPRKKKKAKKNTETPGAKAYRILRMVASATWESGGPYREDALKEYSKFNEKASELLSKLKDANSVYGMNIDDASKAFLFREDVAGLKL